MAFGAPYEEYTRLFALASGPVQPNAIHEYQTLITVLLALTGM